MSDYVVIEEDRVKLALYTAGNLILTLVLMFICAEFMNRISIWVCFWVQQVSDFL